MGTLELIAKILVILLAAVGGFLLIKRGLTIWARRIKSARLRARLSLEDKERYGILPVFRDSKGRQWYAFENPVRMPGNRLTYVEVATRQAQFNMTADTLHQFMVKIEKAMEKGLFIQAAEYIGEIKDRITWAAEVETLLSLSAYYFIVEGEDPKTIVDKTIGEKREFIREDPEARAFFLTASYRIIGELSSTSDSDILAYLAEETLRKKIRLSAESS